MIVTQHWVALHSTIACAFDFPVLSCSHYAWWVLDCTFSTSTCIAGPREDEVLPRTVVFISHPLHNILADWTPSVVLITKDAESWPALWRAVVGTEVTGPPQHGSGHSAQSFSEGCPAGFPGAAGHPASAWARSLSCRPLPQRPSSGSLCFFPCSPEPLMRVGSACQVSQSLCPCILPHKANGRSH